MIVVGGDLDWSVPRTRQYLRPRAGIAFHVASGIFHLVAVVLGFGLNGPVGDDARSTVKTSFIPPFGIQVNVGWAGMVLPFMGETRVIRVNVPCPFTVSVTGIRLGLLGQPVALIVIVAEYVP